MEKVKTNRKSTPGRRIYYQHIPATTIIKKEEYKKDGKKKTKKVKINYKARTIKHIQESNNRIKIAPKIIEQMEHKYKATKASDRTIEKKRDRNRNVLVHDSIKQGTFHGDLKETYKYGSKYRKTS